MKLVKIDGLDSEALQATIQLLHNVPMREAKGWIVNFRRSELGSDRDRPAVLFEKIAEKLF